MKKNYLLLSFVVTSCFVCSCGEQNATMWVSLQVLVVVTIILSIILFAVEHIAQPGVYSNVLDSCLWAFMSYIGDPGAICPRFRPST